MSQAAKCQNNTTSPAAKTVQRPGTQMVKASAGAAIEAVQRIRGQSWPAYPDNPARPGTARHGPRGWWGSP